MLILSCCVVLPCCCAVVSCVDRSMNEWIERVFVKHNCSLSCPHTCSIWPITVHSSIPHPHSTRTYKSSSYHHSTPKSRKKTPKSRKKTPKSIQFAFFSIQFAFFFQSFFLSCVIMEDHQKQKQQHQHDAGHSSDSDTTSSSSSSSDSDSGKGLYSMFDIMEHLPLKKGLSKHFQGKSQSFTSLSNARTLEDLAKPQSKRKLSLFYRNRLKPVNSCSRIISKNPSLLMGHHHHHHHPQTHHHHPQTAAQLSPTIHFCN